MATCAGQVDAWEKLRVNHSYPLVRLEVTSG